MKQEKNLAMISRKYLDPDAEGQVS
jgi:hypothetical protein